jgi:hypothetical protein
MHKVRDYSRLFQKSAFAELIDGGLVNREVAFRRAQGVKGVNTDLPCIDKVVKSIGLL